MQGTGGADVGACQAAFHAAFAVQFDRANPGLPDFKGTFAGDLTLAAVDAVVKVNAHGVANFIVADDAGGAVIDQKFLEGEIKLFLAKDGLCNEFGVRAILNDRDFRFAVDGERNGMGGAGYHAGAASDALLFVHVDGRTFDDASIFEFGFYVRKRTFGANDRPDLAANAAVKIPPHQVIARHHRARDGHFVFGFGFLWNTATHVSPKGLPAGR